MTVSAVPSGQTSSWSPGGRFSRANAFRVLSVPADAELKEIYRQQQRLLVALEIGGLDGTGKGAPLPLSDVSKEEILEAVHRLERPDDRFIEELFWVHEMDGSGDPVEGLLDNVVGALRGNAASNTIRGAVARHNLAVLLSILGQELAGNCRFEHWEEALKTWRKVIDDDLFLTFMKGRALKCDCQISDTGMTRAAVCRQLSSTFSEELAHAVKSRELTAVNALAKIAVEHRSWLELDAALDSLGKQAIKDGYVSLGAILDRLSGITQQDDDANVRNSLVEREKELRSVANEHGAIVRSLGEPTDAVGWDDAIASSYHKLSVAYLKLLDDRQQAIRLIVQAREFAHDAQLLQSMERDWQHVQRTILCREADVLMRRGDFAGADHKLAAALGVSTEEQKIEIKAVQDRCRWGRVLRGADTRKTNPILYTLGGVGAMLFRKGDYDLGTRSYVANHWLTFFFCPIFPLGAYRVTDADSRSYCIHGKVPLSSFLNRARWAIPASVMAVVLVVVLMAIKSRESSAETGGSTTPAPTTPTKAARAAEGRSPISSGGVQHSARDDIDEERTALSVLAQSLEDRKRVLDAEGAKLDKQKRYLTGVESSYSRERVPNGGRSLYEALLADHNDRVNKYNKKLAVFKEDFAAYTERANSLNARIQIFNGSP
jgi:hypothetical protein